jgi:hypothetical protein
MWLSKKVSYIGDDDKEIVIKIFDYPILYGISSYGRWFRFGYWGFGVNVTTKPLFSVRSGYKKSIKLGKYYIVKL